MRVRATRMGWYGNRRRREGAEFTLTLNWIPEQKHTKADPENGIKKGDVVEGTGRYQKFPSWCEEIRSKKTAATGESVQGDDDPNLDDQNEGEGEGKQGGDETPL